MSTEFASTFLKAINEKPELKEQLRAQRFVQNRVPRNEKTVLDIAGKLGYPFTIDEFTTATRTLAAQRMESDEISEEELEKVAAGRKSLSGALSCTN